MGVVFGRGISGNCSLLVDGSGVGIIGSLGAICVAGFTGGAGLGATSTGARGVTGAWGVTDSAGLIGVAAGVGALIEYG